MGYGPCEIYRSKTNWVSKTTNIIGATSLQEGLPWFDPSNAIQNGSKEDDDSHKIPLKLRTTLLRCPWSRYVTSNVPYFCQALTSCSIHMTYAFLENRVPQKSHEVNRTAGYPPLSWQMHAGVLFPMQLVISDTVLILGSNNFLTQHWLPIVDSGV